MPNPPWFYRESILILQPRQREGGVNFFKIRYNKPKLKFVTAGATISNTHFRWCFVFVWSFLWCWFSPMKHVIFGGGDFGSMSPFGENPRVFGLLKSEKELKGQGTWSILNNHHVQRRILTDGSEIPVPNNRLTGKKLEETRMAVMSELERILVYGSMQAALACWIASPKGCFVPSQEVQENFDKVHGIFRQPSQPSSEIACLHLCCSLFCNAIVHFLPRLY